MPRPMKPIIGMSCREDVGHFKGQPHPRCPTRPPQAFLPGGTRTSPRCLALPLGQRTWTSPTEVPAAGPLTPQRACARWILGHGGILHV